MYGKMPEKNTHHCLTNIFIFGKYVSSHSCNLFQMDSSYNVQLCTMNALSIKYTNADVSYFMAVSDKGRSRQSRFLVPLYSTNRHCS